MISTSVRIAGARMEPGRCSRAAGRQARDDGCAAKASVPATSTAPAPASAAPVENSAPAPRASGGPKTQVSSTALASTANARGSESSVRTQAPTGGVANPIPAASAITTGSAAPTGSRAIAREQRRRQRSGRDEHERLPATIDDAAEQRAADAEGDGVGGGDETGRGE